jgi:hypothetical protein
VHIHEIFVEENEEGRRKKKGRKERIHMYLSTSVNP